MSLASCSSQERFVVQARIELELQDNFCKIVLFIERENVQVRKIRRAYIINCTVFASVPCERLGCRSCRRRV